MVADNAPVDATPPEVSLDAEVIDDTFVAEEICFVKLVQVNSVVARQHNVDMQVTTTTTTATQQTHCS